MTIKNNRFKNFEKDKKAISPVITTVLLILLAIVLASIILVWSFGFLGENISKFDPSTNEDKPIDDACSAVSIEASSEGNQISILNTGNVAINKIAVIIISSDGSSQKEEKEINLIAGQSTLITSDINLLGMSVELTPILLAKKQKTGELTEYTCSQKFFVS